MVKKHEVTPFNYNGNALSTISDEHGEIWFVAKDVAEILDYKDATELTKRLDDDDKRNLPVAGFGNRGVIVISEAGLYQATLESTKPEAKPFKKWVTSEVLPSIRKTGGYSTASAQTKAIRDQAEIGLKILESAIKTLRLAPSSAIGSYQTLASHTGLPSNFLPAYAVDAPDSAGSVSSEVTKSLTELLHEFNVDASARKVYPLLEQHGIVKHQSRPSTKGEKQFWSVVDTEYGKNVTHPSNPKETQPAFYVIRFKSLLGMIFPTGGANHV
jgi:prophage antirepressor-like protein